jgi:hypothetical protein
MRRTFSIVFAGLAAGVLAHFGWYFSQRPCQANNLDCQLEWIKTDLHLNGEQFARIKRIHEESSPRLLALAAQVAHMRNEYADFERQRTTVGQVDFLEFARFVEHRRTVDRECLDSTRRLVVAASRVMTAQQRQRYLTLLGPVLGSDNSASPF